MAPSVKSSHRGGCPKSQTSGRRHLWMIPEAPHCPLLLRHLAPVSRCFLGSNHGDLEAQTPRPPLLVLLEPPPQLQHGRVNTDGDDHRHRALQGHPLPLQTQQVRLLFGTRTCPRLRELPYPQLIIQLLYVTSLQGGLKSEP